MTRGQALHTQQTKLINDALNLLGMGAIKVESPHNQINGTGDEGPGLECPMIDSSMSASEQQGPTSLSFNHQSLFHQTFLTIDQGAYPRKDLRSGIRRGNQTKPFLQELLMEYRSQQVRLDNDFRKVFFEGPDPSGMIKMPMGEKDAFNLLRGYAQDIEIMGKFLGIFPGIKQEVSFMEKARKSPARPAAGMGGGPIKNNGYFHGIKQEEPRRKGTRFFALIVKLFL